MILNANQIQTFYLYRCCCLLLSYYADKVNNLIQFIKLIFKNEINMYCGRQKLEPRTYIDLLKDFFIV